MKQEPFSTTDVQNILSIKVQTCKDWLMRGYIKPTISEADGRGTRNLFSLNDLYAIALFKKLIAKGLSRDYASKRTKRIAHKLTHGELSGPRFLKAEYLAFCSLDSDAPEDENEIDMVLIFKDNDLPQKKDHFSKIDFNELNTIENEEDREDILLINFKKLRQKVDQKLK